MENYPKRVFTSRLGKLIEHHSHCPNGCWSQYARCKWGITALTNPEKSLDRKSENKRPWSITDFFCHYLIADFILLSKWAFHISWKTYYLILSRCWKIYGHLYMLLKMKKYLIESSLAINILNFSFVNKIIEWFGL